MSIYHSTFNNKEFRWLSILKLRFDKYQHNIFLYTILFTIISLTFLIIQSLLSDKPSMINQMTQPHIYQKKETSQQETDYLSNAKDPISVIPIGVVMPRIAPFKKKDDMIHLSIELNKSLSHALTSNGIPMRQTQRIIDIASNHLNLSKLRIGHEIDIALDNNPDMDVFDLDQTPLIAKEVKLDISPGIRLQIFGDGKTYQSSLLYKKIHEKTKLARGTIRSSLFIDARRADVPPKIISEFIKLFSLNIDFRELQKNDKFELVYDQFTDENGNLVGYSNLNYASLTVDGKKHENFSVYDALGKRIWINEDGRNNKPLLMRTPIDGARLTSRFGMRRHPVLGYTKKHKGIDFAAPRGTPIYAAGDGVIVKRYRSNSFGNYIKIKHTKTYSTAYAHMSRFARYKIGQRVKQGQVIGYVGTTGRSTGPHLHYEVHKNNVQINPLSKSIPTVSTITAAMKRSLQTKRQHLVKLRNGQEIKKVHSDIKKIKNLTI